MRLFLGIDGGQSTTTAVIGDDSGRILGSGRGGPCNHVGSDEGWKKFSTAVGGCLHVACEQAALDLASVSFERVCAGFSGGPGDKIEYLKQLVRANDYDTTTDAVIALAGATAGQPGMICIAWNRIHRRTVGMRIESSLAWADGATFSAMKAADSI